MCMASKTINIDSKLYEKIKLMKNEKSFTEFLSELIDKIASPPTELFGILNEEDLDYDEIKKSRVDRNVDF